MDNNKITIKGTKIRDIKIDPSLQKGNTDKKFYMNGWIDSETGNKACALIEHFKLKSQAALIITMVNNLFESFKPKISKPILKKYKLLDGGKK